MPQLEWYSCIDKEESYEKPTDEVLFMYYFSKYWLLSYIDLELSIYLMWFLFSSLKFVLLCCNL